MSQLSSIDNSFSRFPFRHCGMGRRDGQNFKKSIIVLFIIFSYRYRLSGIIKMVLKFNVTLKEKNHFSCLICFKNKFDNPSCVLLRARDVQTFIFSEHSFRETAFFFYLQLLKILNIFVFRTTYPNIISISVLCCWSSNSQSLRGFLKYLPKNMALLFQKLWRKKLSKYISGYFKKISFKGCSNFYLSYSMNIHYSWS